MKKVSFLTKMVLIAMICGAVLASCGGRSGQKGAGKTCDDAAKTEAACAAKTDEDKMLDEFEKFVDEYVEILKAVMSGDAAAVARSEQLTAGYEDLMLRITLAEEAGKFTDAQKERGQKIGEKMAAAFQ